MASSNICAGLENTQFINTNGNCFLCCKTLLVENDDSSPGDHEEEEAKLFNFQFICHHLKINASKLLGCGSEPSFKGFSAILCLNCYKVTARLSNMCEELELVRMRVEDALIPFKALLPNVTNYRLGHSNGDKFLVDVLREETQRKCDENFKVARIPRVMISRLILKEDYSESRPDSPLDNMEIVTSQEFPVKQEPEEEHESDHEFIPSPEPADSDCESLSNESSSSDPAPSGNDKGNTHFIPDFDPSTRRGRNFFKSGNPTLWKAEKLVGQHGPQSRKYICNFCTRKFSGGTTKIRYHVVSIHPEKLFPGCQLENVTEEDFKCYCRLALEQVVSETDSKVKAGKGTIHSCHFCDKDSRISYNDKRVMENHLLGEHHSIITERLMKIQNRKHEQILGEFSGRIRSHDNVKTRVGEGTWRCKICGKGFTKKHYLNRHYVRSACGIGTFSCDKCKEKFDLKRNWIHHKKFGDCKNSKRPYEKLSKRRKVTSDNEYDNGDKYVCHDDASPLVEAVSIKQDECCRVKLEYE